MNREKWIFALALIVITVFAYPEYVYPQERPVSGKTSLWRVSKGKSDLYLLGSIHFLRKDSYPLPAAMDKAFDGADTVVFEMDLDGAGPGNQQMLLLGRGMYAQGQTLSKRIGRDTYELTRNSLGSLGIKIEQVEKFKPWFISLYIMALKLQMSGFDPGYGVDRHFLSRAKEAGRKVIGLETLEEQIELFDGFPDKDQEMMLRQTIKELETMDAEVKKLVNAWRQGNADVLDEMIMKSYRDYPAIYDRLMVRRNKQWMSRIEELLNREGKSLVVVGVGHLVGGEGLVKELQRRGCTVVQQ